MVKPSRNHDRLSQLRRYRALSAFNTKMSPPHEVALEKSLQTTAPSPLIAQGLGIARAHRDSVLNCVGHQADHVLAPALYYQSQE